MDTYQSMTRNPLEHGRSEDRLHPWWWSDRYYHLTALKRQLEIIVAQYLHRKDLVLVDLGCGDMPYRPLFEPLTAQYIGVDLPGNQQADVHLSPRGETFLEDDLADVVLSTQVLEHVENPGAYLRECNRILKPGGLLIISTHGYWMYHPDPTDFWRWTSSGLSKILQAAGFKIIYWQGVMGLASTAVQLFQDAVTRKLPGFIKVPFIIIAQFFIMLCDKMQPAAGRNADACVFVSVALKQPVSSLDAEM